MSDDNIDLSNFMILCRKKNMWMAFRGHACFCAQFSKRVNWKKQYLNKASNKGCKNYATIYILRERERERERERDRFFISRGRRLKKQLNVDLIRKKTVFTFQPSGLRAYKRYYIQARLRKIYWRTATKMSEYC